MKLELELNATMQVWVCNNWSGALLELATMGFNTYNNELKRDRRAPMIGASEWEREGGR